MPIIVDPTPAIAKSAGYKLPDSPSQPTGTKSVNAWRQQAKCLANLNFLFTGLLSAEERKLLLDVQSRSAALIAGLHANTQMSVKQAYDADIADGKKVNQLVSLEERLSAAKGKREIFNAKLDRIINQETKPICVRVLARALELARAEFSRFQEAEGALWSKYQVVHETSELFRSLYDAIARIEDAVTTKLAGQSGEVVPNSILSTYLGIQL
ncbi:MAG TPA: hypothetical protein VFT34_17455 [Verrucomicrobiae bacterium]|nr:hypothetical protein [Verrucomicrobiae bacterium]